MVQYLLIHNESKDLGHGVAIKNAQGFVTVTYHTSMKKMLCSAERAKAVSEFANTNYPCLMFANTKGTATQIDAVQALPYYHQRSNKPMRRHDYHLVHLPGLLHSQPES